MIITIENCLLQLTPFRQDATFKVRLRRSVELPSTAARALNL